MVGLWGSSAVSGVLLEIFSELLRLDLRPCKLSGVLLDASGPVSIFFQNFWTSLGNMFLNFKHNVLFYIEMFFKFVFLFILFLSYVAVCDVTWSAELPEGSSFMF